MKNFLFLLLGLFTCIATFAGGTTDSSIIIKNLLPVFKNWTTVELVKGGRIDAIKQIKDEIIVCATRGANKGELFISRNYGNSWELLAQPTTSEITCIAETGEANEFYILTGEAEVYKTTDGGKDWEHLITLTTNKNRERYTASYSIMCTGNGTLLVTDTNSDGGHIYRSTDKGATWRDLGVISKNALYRLEKCGNGIIVNGWGGAVYKSTDDGLTWNKMQQLSNTALFATEYLGMSTLLQADQGGNIYRSTNLGYVWEHCGNLKDAADDFINIGYGAAYYSTYTGEKKVYITLNNGKKWWDADTIPTVAGDWLDHGIRAETADSVIMLAGTSKGFVIRNAISKNQLFEMVNTYNKKSVDINAERTRSLKDAMKGHLVDIDALNEPEDIVAHNGFAYVPCRDGNNVAIIDYRDNAHPKLVHNLRDEDILDAFSVALKDNHLYVLSMTNCRISVFNIKNPAKPLKVSAITVGKEGSYLSTYRSNYTRLRKIVIQEDYAYVSHSSESKIYILNISNPNAPVIVSSFHTGDGAFALLPRGNALYLAGYGPGSSVITADISDKTKPIITSRIYDSVLLKGTCALAASGNKLYAVAYNAGTFWSLDISDPFHPAVDSYISDPDMQGPGRIVVKDDYAYVLNSTNNSVAAVNIFGDKPTIKFFLQDPLIKRVYGIAIDGDTLLLAGREAKSFVVLDLKILTQK